jgi:hypothetical protein
MKQIKSPVPLTNLISDNKEVKQCRFLKTVIKNSDYSNFLFFCDKEAIYLDPSTNINEKPDVSIPESIKKSASMFNNIYAGKSY